jgi:hypothetical protein
MRAGRAASQWRRPACLALLLAACGRDTGPGADDFVMVAAHLDASAQPTPRGRILAVLAPFQGRLYTGYGDIDANTGPIAVAAYDPARGALVREWTSDTEAVYTYRIVDGRLVAPAIDPRSDSDYAIGPPWRDLRPLRADHVYDAATLSGRDLWLAGSQGLDAVLWRIDEAGQAAVVLRVPPADQSGADFGRFYFVFAHRGRLYVHARDFNRGPKPTSLVWDGGAWSEGPSLLPLPDAQGWHPQPFAGRIVYTARQTVASAEGSRLFVFDGAAVSQPLSEPVRDVAVGADRVAALLADGRILVSANLADWTEEARAPSNARSLGLLGRDLYVGTDASEILRSRRPLS